MAQVPVGLKRRVQQRGVRGLPRCPLLATPASVRSSHLSLFNISPRTPKKMHWNQWQWSLVFQRATPPRGEHGCGLQPQFTGRTKGTPHASQWGPQVSLVPVEKRRCLGQGVMLTILSRWLDPLGNVRHHFISEEVKIPRPMVPASLLTLKPHCSPQQPAVSPGSNAVYLLKMLSLQ